MDRDDKIRYARGAKSILEAIRKVMTSDTFYLSLFLLLCIGLIEWLCR